MASKWVKMKFLELGVNRKVVGNVENYRNMKFQPKIWTSSWKNAKKPHFLTYFLIWLPSICKNHHAVCTKVVENDENYLNMKFQPKTFTRSWKNAKKTHFLTYFLIWLPSICENRHTLFTKVVDNDSVNISGKFEASILRTFWEKSFLTHIDCSQVEKWPQNGWRWNFSSLVSINMKFQPNIFTRSRENAEKPHFLT